MTLNFLNGGWSFFVPESILTGAALLLLLLDSNRSGRRTLSLLVALGALVAAGVAVGRTGDGVAFGLFAMDGVARFLKVLLAGAVILTLALSARFKAFESDGGDPFPWGTYAALLLLASVGLFLLASANDFLAALIALELVSVSSFILVGFVRRDRRSGEAAIKYFLVGAFASALMIYGISLLFGVTGTTGAGVLSAATATRVSSLPLTAALFFILAGFGFKLALAPFHMWVPDVYEGAPTPITAFLSVAPKAAAFGLLVRLLGAHHALGVTPLLALLSALTMTVGNLGALNQRNVKRLLGYSSIAQMGYVMIGFVAAGTVGLRALLVYLAAYVFMNLGAFAAVIAVTEDAGTESLDAFDGLASRSLPLALVTTFFLLSLTGLPPFIGFIGKFSLFSAAVQSPGLMALAIVGVVNSVISFAYYFSIVRAMFFAEAKRTQAPLVNGPLWAALGVTSMVTVVSGLFPNPLLAWVQRVLP